MRSYPDCTNAFSPSFLEPFMDRDEPPTGAEADVAGPWRGIVGHFELLDEALLDAVNVTVGLVRSPQSLAYLLEAAGPAALERCGAILAAVR